MSAHDTASKTPNKRWGFSAVTKRAIGTVAFSAFAVLMGYLTGYPVVVLIGCATFLVLFVAVLFILRPPGATLKRDVTPLQVTRGEVATVTLGRRNRSPLPAQPVEATDHIGHLTVDVTIPLAPPGQPSDASYRFVTSRRGVLTIGPARLTRRDPWGMFQRTRDVGGTKELLVFPRVLTMAAPDIVNRLGRDASAADVAAGSDRFHTLREYVKGDELRKVHWPSSAKTGTLMIKQMVDAPQPRLLLFLDCDAGAYVSAEAFEQAVDTTVSVAEAIIDHGIEVIVSAGRNQATMEISRRADFANLLDTFALVDHESSPISAGQLRGQIVKQRATALVAVTGTGNAFLPTLTSIRSLIGEATVFRVGEPGRPTTTRRRGLVLFEAPDTEGFVELLPVVEAPSSTAQGADTAASTPTAGATR